MEKLIQNLLWIKSWLWYENNFIFLINVRFSSVIINNPWSRSLLCSQRCYILRIISRCFTSVAIIPIIGIWSWVNFKANEKFLRKNSLIIALVFDTTVNRIITGRWKKSASLCTDGFKLVTVSKLDIVVFSTLKLLLNKKNNKTNPYSVEISLIFGFILY